MYNVGIIISGGPPFGTAPTNYCKLNTQKEAVELTPNS